jgi:hypothetical protein
VGKERNASAARTYSAVVELASVPATWGRSVRAWRWAAAVALEPRVRKSAWYREAGGGARRRW